MFLSMGLDGRFKLSLSARRAWIEISSLDDILAGVNEVALRKESVDRNNSLESKQIDPSVMSLSARRAWIEIASGTLSDTSEVVALRKESVDRNSYRSGYFRFSRCRSPQGERG